MWRWHYGAMADTGGGSEPPDERQLRAIAAKYGYGDVAISPMPATGEVNWIYAMGEGAVLRISNNAHPDGVRDGLTESVAVPAVRDAGIRTPQLLALDNSHDIIDALFTIYERAPGQDLASSIAAGLPLADRLYRQLGQELAKLHRDVTQVADPNGWLDNDPRWTSPEAMNNLLSNPRLDTRSADILASLYEQVEPSLRTAGTFRRFLHQDLSFGNVMACDGELSAIIDWGDAGWADPAQEFAYLPLAIVDTMLVGYREIMPLDGDDTAEARILWDHVGRAVYDLYNRSALDDRPGRSAAGAQFIDLVGFLLSNRGQKWLAGL